MLDDEFNSRLSRISTQWTLVRKAHQVSNSEAIALRNELMEHYTSAAYRYLYAIVRDADLADELFQEFALRFVRGSFKNVDPGRGKFRKYIKSVLINLVLAFRKKNSRNSVQLHEHLVEPASDEDFISQSEQQFNRSWREELLAQAWVAIKKVEDESGKPFYTALRYKSEHPGASTVELANAISRESRPGQPWTESSTRKILQRARERFADLLLGKVRHSLENPSLSRLEDELIELELYEYCRKALKQLKS